MPNKGTKAAMEKSELTGLIDEKLFDSLYERYFEKAFGYALFYCGTKQMAEDVVQDVFLKVWEHLPKLKHKIKDWYAWRSFLFVLIRNRAGNLMRHNSKHVVFSAGYSMMVNPVVYDDRILEREGDRIFIEGVKKLSYQQKEIFVLKYYRFKPKTIAMEMNLAPGTVSNTLAAARKALNDHVNRQFEIDDEMIKLANTG